MGQHSVIFHAFLACLVPTADAVGVAPSGLSSSDFYRSRRFRTTNSTPSVASVQNSQESAVAILDDLSRKSRVFLAQNRSAKITEHRLLTWNAGGGAPQPEFLGGPWETDHGGIYSKVEQMTAVLLFELAGCGTVPKQPKKKEDKAEDDEKKWKNDPKVNFDDNQFVKYRNRYRKMYNAVTKIKDKDYVYKDLRDELDGLTMQKLLGSLKTAVDSTAAKNALPGWVKSGDQPKDPTCTVRTAIADALGLCPSQASKDAEDAKKKEAEDAKKGDFKPRPEIGRQPCDNFDLKSEGCWKARGALPVYGERFFELYAARQNKKDTAGYWKLFMEGLEAQETKPGKGCNPNVADKFPKDGQPGKHIKLTKGAEATYEIGEGDAKTSANIPTPEIFTFEQWSKTAFWDTLLIDLTALSVKFIQKIDEEDGGDDNLKLTEGEGDKKKYKAVQYIDKTAADAQIETIVTGAKQHLKPDVLFAQELEVKDRADETEYASQRAKEDTAIYVRTDFGGGIDKEASANLQWLWDGMMGGISGAFEMERNKIMAQSLGGADKLKALDSSTDPADKKKLAAEYIAAGGKIPYTSIPAQQLPTWDDGGGDEESMKERIETQTAGFAKAAVEKGLVYATKLALVTVAMTAQDPKVMLLSIHADSDGYYCAQYLNLAKKFYDTISHDHKLTAMYIGMDANVQPPHGHPSWDNKKGFTFMQLRRALPEKMAMVDPKLSTVKKVRTFLQTQFAKIGKDDEERKDLLFVYPYVSEDHINTKVYNVFNGEEFSFVGDERARDENGHRVDPPEEKKKDDDDDDDKEKKKEPPSFYYPTNDWPVDHFMSYAAVTIDGEAPAPQKRSMCDVLKRGLKAANPFKKLVANLLVRTLAKQALAELKKPEPETTEEKEKPKEEPKENATPKEEKKARA